MKSAVDRSRGASRVFFKFFGISDASIMLTLCLIQAGQVRSMSKGRAMRLGEEDGEKLNAGFGAMRDLEAELDAIDRTNDPDASENVLEILDQMFTLSMAMGPLRKKLATGQNGHDSQ